MNDLLSDLQFENQNQWFSFLEIAQNLFHMGNWRHVYVTEQVIKSVSQIKRVNLSSE